MTRETESKKRHRHHTRSSSSLSSHSTSSSSSGSTIKRKNLRNKKQKALHVSSDLTILGCNKDEAIRLLMDLIKIEKSLGNELIELVSRVADGEAVSVNKIENTQVRKKLRHLLAALGLKVIVGKGTTPEEKVFELPFNKDVQVNLLRGFRKLLNKAAGQLGISWKELRKSIPNKTECHEEIISVSSIFVDDTGRQLSLMEMHRAGLTPTPKQAPEQFTGQYFEPWGKPQAEQRYTDIAKSRAANDHSEPWAVFDREREIERSVPTRGISKAQYSCLFSDNASLKNRFASSRRPAPYEKSQPNNET